MAPTPPHRPAPPAASRSRHRDLHGSWAWHDAEPRSIRVLEPHRDNFALPIHEAMAVSPCEPQHVAPFGENLYALHVRRRGDQTRDLLLDRVTALRSPAGGLSHVVERVRQPVLL